MCPNCSSTANNDEVPSGFLSSRFKKIKCTDCRKIYIVDKDGSTYRLKSNSRISFLGLCFFILWLMPCFFTRFIEANSNDFLTVYICFGAVVLFISVLIESVLTDALFIRGTYCHKNRNEKEFRISQFIVAAFILFFIALGFYAAI